ncbi:MATE family efflux transporter [Synergistaceae bacterium OttesenSCG-928-D05]|nr:MATE family efflux transporter [Synergistaceae bacterium OttesenSCG-928-D05]
MRLIEHLSSLRKKVDLGSGPVLRTLIFLSIPSIAMVLSNTLCHLVDTIFISWLGEVQMVAVSFTFPVQIGIFAILEGVGNGVTALVGRNLGAGRLNEARNTALAGMGFAYTLCLLWVPLMLPQVSNVFFNALGANNPEVLRQAWLYNVWVPPTIVLISYSFIANSIFRCQGNTIIPLIYMVITNIVNLVLDPIFIFYFGWGVGGAAAATFLGRLAGAFFILKKLQTDSMIKVPYKPYVKARMFKTWGKITAIGLPVALSTGSVALGMGSVNKILSGAYGHQAVAGWMVGIRVEDLAFNTIMGVQNALVPFLAFNYGRRDLPRMKEGLKSALKIGACITGGLGLLVFLFPHPVIDLFRPSEAVAAMAVRSIRTTFIGYPAVIYSVLANGFFIATGFSAYGLMVQIVRSLILRIAAVYYLAQRVSVDQIWWFQPISFVGGALLAAFFFSVLLRKLRRDME